MEAVLLTVFFVGGATALVFNARRVNRSDRLNYQDEGLRHSSDWIGVPGRFTASVSLELQENQNQTESVATVERALRKAGVHNLQANENDVQGWTRLSVVGLQVGVKLFRRSNGTVLVTVSGRPRYASATAAWGQHQKIAGLVAQALSDEWTATATGPS